MGETRVQKRAGSYAGNSVQSTRNKPQPFQGKQLVGQEHSPDDNDKNQDSTQLAANFMGVACAIFLQCVESNWLYFLCLTTTHQ